MKRLEVSNDAGLIQRTIAQEQGILKTLDEIGKPVHRETRWNDTRLDRFFKITPVVLFTSKIG